MASEWKRLALGQICKFKYGQMPKKTDLCETGFPVFSGYGIVGFANSYHYEQPEVIVVARGVGGTGDVKFSPPKCFLTNLSIAAQIASPEVDKQFLFFRLNHPSLWELRTGSAQAQITIERLNRHEVDIPSLPTQRKIAGILSAYDDLIENISRRITILEEIAQAIYREWFVHFRFPGHEKVRLIDSPLGKIPEGWQQTSLGEFVTRGLVDLQTGPFGTQLRASDYTESGTPVINVRNIGYGSIRTDKLEHVPDIVADRLSVHILKCGDIVFGRKGAVDRHVLVTSTEDGWMQGSDCIRLRSLCEEVCSFYLSFAFRERMHHEWMLSQCSHGATMASLNQDVIRRIPVHIASKSVRNSYYRMSVDVVREISTLRRKADNLRQTRDLLLPKLISGQLDVEELYIETGEPLAEAVP